MTQKDNSLFAKQNRFKSQVAEIFKPDTHDEMMQKTMSA